MREFPRTAVWTCQAGSSIHELTDPAGTTYVMESYSQQVDPAPSWQRLDTLGPAHCAAGLVVLIKTVEQDLVLGNGGTAFLVHDDLDNSYQQNTTGAR